MLSADHPFKQPVDSAILSHLRESFVDASRQHPRVTFTAITSFKPWPMLGVNNVSQLLDAMVRYMGRDERPCLQASASPSMGPPWEFFFAQPDALDSYRGLARRVGEQTPLGSHEEWPSQRWTYTLRHLALEGAVFFRAPEKRLHCYPRGMGQGWFWAEEHQAPEYLHPVAVVCYWQLANLWAASMESLEVWGKRTAEDAGATAATAPAPGEASHGAECNPPRRGRKSSCDPEKDRKIAEEWTRAKDAGVVKKDFAADKKLPLRVLNRLLNRQAKRAKKSRN